jgi:hypothetical protein
MPSFSSKLQLNSAASSSGLALADIDVIAGAFYTVAAYNDLADIPIARVTDNQIVWVEDASSTYQATITQPDYVSTFVPTVTWAEFSGFGSGGGGGSGDITAVVAGDGLGGGAFSGTATLNVNTGSGITINSDAVALDTGSSHFIDGVVDLSIFQQTGSIYNTTNELGVTGSLTLRKDNSDDAISIYSGSVKTFGITGNGLLKLVSQSVQPTAHPGALYLDENYNLWIGQE